MLWDCQDPSIFVLFDSANIYTYVYKAVTINGPQIVHLTTQAKNSGLTPIVLNNGTITGRLKNSQMETILLDSHRPLQVCHMWLVVHALILLRRRCL